MSKFNFPSNLRAKWRPRHFAISTGCRGHPCRRKCETHRGFQIQLSDLPFPISRLVRVRECTLSLTLALVKPFYIFNSLTRAVEEFQALNPPEVTLYSCGPTVYLPQHLGNLRAYVFVDSIRRALELNGYKVRHVMNVTDVGHMTSDEDAGEDKIEKTARAQGKSPLEVANFYLEQFQRDCAALNLEAPQVWSRATDHVGDMIALTKRIIDAGVAYVTKSGVYFDVEKYRGENRFGRLSLKGLDEQNAAQRLGHST